MIKRDSKVKNRINEVTQDYLQVRINKLFSNTHNIKKYGNLHIHNVKPNQYLFSDYLKFKIEPLIHKNIKILLKRQLD
ncbi:hypothetical protein HD_0280 [[Haemophilus] ducreyi 35000HP]|uniref:Uncharacterized protein n=1 Tax=Haemophilus ducreyi (strain 35000HP / ATCC 700724) TaxID=233412 RepID=Q7VP28_HAEDU|nr:hypothetical protein HD_0280 [[Haemophilus] ducreyi 35000HP]SEV99939.1 hypothetical protein SAMN02983000_0998 [[Haemophilus] ducreyi]VEG82549.1 Uncharacterised protein [[Haemophilus] ducreyi]